MSSNKASKRFVSHELKLDAMFRVYKGETKASVARALGIPESTLRGWCKNHVLIRRLPRRPDSSPPVECKRAKLEEPIDLTTDSCSFNSPGMLDSLQQDCTREFPAKKYVNLTEINLQQKSWFWKWYKSVNTNGDWPRMGRDKRREIDDAMLNELEFVDNSITRREAIEHGEKLLKWLESRRNNPSISAVQVAQVRKLVDNIKRTNKAFCFNEIRTRRK